MAIYYLVFLCFVLALLISITYRSNLFTVISYAIYRYVSVDNQRLTPFLTVFKLGTIHIKGSESLCTGSIFRLIPRYSHLMNASYSQSSRFSTFWIPKLNPVRNKPLSTPLILLLDWRTQDYPSPPSKIYLWFMTEKPYFKTDRWFLNQSWNR